MIEKIIIPLLPMISLVLFLSIVVLKIVGDSKAKKENRKRKFFSLPKPRIVILAVIGFLLLGILAFWQRQNLNEFRNLMALQETLSKFCGAERKMPTGWKELDAKGYGRLIENGTQFAFDGYWQCEIVVKDYEIRFGLSREDVEKMEKPLLIHVKDKWWRHGEDCEYISKTLLKCMQEGRDLYGSIDEEADSATRKSVPKPVPDPSQNSIE
jgi:hypothetical protein